MRVPVVFFDHPVWHCSKRKCRIDCHKWQRAEPDCSLLGIDDSLLIKHSYQIRCFSCVNRSKAKDVIVPPIMKHCVKLNLCRACCIAVQYAYLVYYKLTCEIANHLRSRMHSSILPDNCCRWVMNIIYREFALIPTVTRRNKKISISCIYDEAGVWIELDWISKVEWERVANTCVIQSNYFLYCMPSTHNGNGEWFGRCCYH